MRVDGTYILTRNAHWPSGVFSVLTGFLEEDESPATHGSSRHFSFRERNQPIIAFMCEGQGSLELGTELCETRRVPEHDLGA